MAKIVERERMAKALRKNQDFILNIVESVPFLIFIYDPERWRCIYANNRITEALGYTPEDLYLLGDRFLDRVADEAAFSFYKKSSPDSDLGDDAGETKIECLLRHADGRWRRFIIQKVGLTSGAQGEWREILCGGAAVDE